MTRLFSVALIAALVACVGFAEGATKVPADCGKPLVERPTALTIACGDAALFADHLKWIRWGGRRSVAKGRIGELTCQPDCASGKVRYHQGKVILTQPVRCGVVQSYRHAIVRWGGRKHWDEPWAGCGF